MKLRLQSGMTFVEYRSKLGEIADAIATMEDPPPGNADCRVIATGIREAFEALNAAVEPWRNEIRYDSLRKTASSKEGWDRLLDLSFEQGQVRKAKWAEGVAKIDETVARWQSLQAERSK